MTGFSAPVDIANRALQHVGGARIVNLTDTNRNANSVNFCYDKLRKSELRRNVWRFATRRAVLRPVDVTTMNFVPGAWDTTKSYLLGSIVSYGSLIYQALAPVAVAGLSPDQVPSTWTLYFGPLTIQPYDTTGTSAYYSGELVYDTVGNVYLSVQSNNTVAPTSAAAAWSSTTIYNLGQTVTYSAVTYQSTKDLNVNVTPTGAAPWVTIPVTQPDTPIGQSWLKLGSATVTSLNLIYPLGSGPSSQTATRNVFFLPNGFLREAPQSPKAGSTSYLGAPAGLAYTDWEYEGQYFCSMETTPIVYRFCADVAYVPSFDALFCEGLACRIALEICEEITQSTEKIEEASKSYMKFMGEARAVNGIETGATEPPEDDYISCRY